MNDCSKILLVLGLSVSLLLGLYPSTDIAMSASAPGVNVLPAITTGVHTPVRLAADPSGNIYATDPHAGGILKFSSAGNQLQKIVTPKSGAGVVISPNGSLLVSQVNYVIVLDPATGNEINRFGTFSFANGITIDTSNNVYVTDSKNNNLQKFSYNSSTTPGTYNWVATSDTGNLPLSRPTGIAYDKYNGRLAIANSLNGTIEFVNPVDLTLLETVGVRGYDPAPVYPASPKFSYPQGIAFEYNQQTGKLERIYVAESFQANIQVLDGVTNARIADFGGYGFVNGKLFAPSDVLFDPFSQINKRVFVANGGGTIAVFGIDNMQPTNIQVGSATLNSLTVSWVNPTDPTFSSIHVYRSATAGQIGIPVGGNLTGTSYTDGGLDAGTTYYYTVRAVTTGNAELANTQPVSGTTRINYTLTLTTSGAGTINGTASCGENTTTQTPILDNTLVTLTALPNALSSTFTGWSGACTGSDVTCQVRMDAAKNATATFTLRQPFYVNGNYFDNLQDAYNAAIDGSAIEIMAGAWPVNAVGAMTADRAITVTLKGGYDSQYSDPPTSGSTYLSGRINVQAGKLIMNNVKLK